jgi:hypothetical protein
MRGFYPFAYAPRDHWDQWVGWLALKKEDLCTKLAASI